MQNDVQDLKCPLNFSDVHASGYSGKHIRFSGASSVFASQDWHLQQTLSTDCGLRSTISP